MNHEAAAERLPDLLVDRDDHELLAHLKACHECQARLFRLARVDRALRATVRGRRRHGRSLERVGGMLVAAAAVAAVAVVMTAYATKAPAAELALRSASGGVVARASFARGDGENESLALVAHGLPAHPVDTYALWTRGRGDGRAVLVGRFMVSHDGECRARFNVPGAHHSSQFWITPVGSPADVVATT